MGTVACKFTPQNTLFMGHKTDWKKMADHICSNCILSFYIWMYYSVAASMKFKEVMSLKTLTLMWFA